MAYGWSSLFSNTTGSSNTADGFQALYGNNDSAATPDSEAALTA
jgi:hypothetical protein